MTYTGDSTTESGQNEIQYNNNGLIIGDPNLLWEQINNSLTVSGKIEQKVSNINLSKQFDLGAVSGIYFQGGNLFTTIGNEVLKLTPEGKIINRTTLADVPNVILNNGVNIYTLSTTTDTITVLDQDLNTVDVVVDNINLDGPTRFIRYGKYLFITCGSKLSRFDTAINSVDASVDIIADVFVDITIKGNSLFVLRNTSVSEIDPDTLQIIKNVPSSNITNPRRIESNQDGVFALTNNSIVIFDNTLKYIGKTTSQLDDAVTISLYGSFIIVSNNSGSISIFDSSNIPATLVKNISVSVSPNNFKNSIIVGNKYYLTDFLSGNLLQYVLDGIVVGGIKAGSAQITSIETTEISSETISTKNFSTQNFYTSGSIDGTIGNFGGISIGDGAVYGPSVRIDSGTQSLLMDAEGLKYLNNDEEIIKFKNNGTFESNSIETEIFKISNGLNKFQISASPSMTQDQILIFPDDNGNFGDFLSTDGDGNLLWKALEIEGGGGIPGGFSTHVQFNENGVFSASDKFKWDGKYVQVGANNQIKLGHDIDTSVSKLSLGVNNEINISLDNGASQIKFVNNLNEPMLSADYNSVDGASFTIGNLQITDNKINLLNDADESKITIEHTEIDGPTLTVGSVIITTDKLTGLADPVANSDAVNKSYVDAATSSNGNSSFWKSPVKATTTAEITTFPPTDGIDTVATLDDVSLSIGDRVLVKDQSTGTENGIYEITADTWIRAPDLDTDSVSKGITVKVLNGNRYVMTNWVCTSGDITGTNSLVFEQTNLTSGISWKESVRCATTVEITPFPPTDGIDTVTSIDSITVSIGDRVLIKNQSIQTENGIYEITSGTWQRTNDMNTDSVASGNATWVNEGSTYGDQGWVCVSDSSIVGTSNLVFDIMSAETSPGGSDTHVQFSSGGVFTGSADFTWDGTSLKATNMDTSSLILNDVSNTITLQTPTLAVDYTLILPTTVGTANQVLSTGATPGTTEWVNKTASSGEQYSIQINDGANGFTASNSFKINNNILQVGTDEFELNYDGTGSRGVLLNNKNANNFTFRTNASTSYNFEDNTGAVVASISDTGLITTETGLSLTDQGVGTNKITIQAGDGSTAVTAHTLILPPAQGAASTVLTNDGAGILTWEATGGTSTSIVLEDPGAGTNTITLQAPTLAGDYTLTLPTTGGTINQLLKTDGNGATEWANIPLLKKNTVYRYPIPETNSNNNFWRSVVWSPELYILVTVSSNGAMTSPDGITWTLQTSAEIGVSVCWSPELTLFVAVASNKVMTSPNGITWTARTVAEANFWTSVVWSPELTLFVAVSYNGTNRVMTSPNGINWTSRTAAEANNWNSVCWSPELTLFVAVANSGTNRVMTSPNGITWTSRSVASNNWNSVCWSPELTLFVAVATFGTNRVITSPNGITWTSRSAAEDNQWQSVKWIPELALLVAVSIDGTNRIMTSPDGTNWDSFDLITTAALYDICSSPELYLNVITVRGDFVLQISNNITYEGNLDTKTLETTSLTLKDSVDQSHSITIQTPDISSDYTLNLPTTIGTANQLLSTGATPGTMEWVEPPVTNAAGADTQIQFNSGGTTFAGSANLTFDALSSTFKQISNVDPVFVSDITCGAASDPSAVVVIGKIAYVVCKAKLILFDISDPSNMSQMSTVAITSADLKDIVVRDGIAFLSTRASNTVLLYDVSDPTSTPTLIKIITGVADAAYMTINGNYLYVGQYQNNAGFAQLTVIDFSDPPSAAIVDTLIFGGSSRDVTGLTVFGKGKYLLATCWESSTTTLVIVDISDPTNVSVVNTIVCGINPIGSVLSSDGRYAFIAFYGEANVKVFDVADPLNVSLVHTLFNSYLTGARTIRINGNNLYVTSSGFDRVTRIDATDPLNLAYKGTYASGASLDQPYGFDVSGNYGFFACIASEKLSCINLGGVSVDSLEASAIKAGHVSIGKLNVLTDIDTNGTLSVGGKTDLSGNVNISGELVSKETTSYSINTGNIDYEFKNFITSSELTGLTDRTTGMYIEGDIGYLIGNSKILTTVNLSDMNNITAYSTATLTTDTGGLRGNCAVKNGYLYLAASGTEDLRTYDITDPNTINVTPISTLGPSFLYYNNIRTMEFTDDGNTLVLISSESSSQTNGSQIITTIDVTTASTPAFLDSLEVTTVGAGFGSCISGNYAFCVYNSIFAIDISTPGTIGTPVSPSPVITTASTRYSKVVGNYLYILRDGQGLIIVDVSTPAINTSMVTVGSYIDSSLFNETFEFVIVGNEIYISNKDAGKSVIVLDITTKSAPTLKKTISSSQTYWVTDIWASIFPPFRYHRNNFLFFNEDSDSLFSLSKGSVNFPDASLTKVSSESLKLNNVSGKNIEIVASASLASNYKLNLPTTIGTANQVLSTGSTPGTMEWITPAAAAGADTQIQFNSGGTDLGGSSNLTWSGTVLGVNGTVDATTFKVAKSSVTQATSVNTGVTINSSAGIITTVSLVIASHEFETFTVTNSLCYSTSIVMCQVSNYSGPFNLHCRPNNISNGSFDVVLINGSGGALDGIADVSFFII